MKKSLVALALATTLTACGKTPETVSAEKQVIGEKRKTDAQKLVDGLVFVQRTDSKLCFLVRPETMNGAGWAVVPAIIIKIECDSDQ